MENTELKVGDRVRLTDWSKEDKNDELAHSIFKREGLSFPLDCEVNGKFSLGFTVLRNWNLSFFTFEKLTDETPIP